MQRSPLRFAPRRTAWLVVAALTAGCGDAGPGPTASPDRSAAPTSTRPPSQAPAASSTLDPTAQPGGPSATARPRTAVEINPNPVDRPGVPGALHEGFWWTTSDAGRLGTTARMGVPSGERILHVADGLVATARHTDGTDSTITLVVRDFETGAEIRNVVIDLASVDARVVGRRLFWSGMSKVELDRDEAIDGGVWAIGVDGGDRHEIVAPGTVIGTTWAARRLLLSPSAGTLAAVLDTIGDDAFADVIDVASMEHDGRLDNVWPWAITDVAFLQWDQQPSASWRPDGA